LNSWIKSKLFLYLALKKPFQPVASEMIYHALLIALAVFTLLDAANTAVGLRIGLIELNPIVKQLGLHSWVMFRILLLGCMVTAFFEGHRFCLKHFKKGTWILEITLFILDSFIGTVAFSGFLAIYFKLLF